MATDPADTAKIVTVSEGLYVRQAVDNMGWIDLGDCALAVDALEQRRLEAEVFAAIQSTLGEKPVRYLLNTHTHGDHVALNAAFQKRFGTEVVRALFVGDLFGWGLINLSRSLTDETAKLLADTYERLIGFDAAVVIPGHGPLCTTAELTRQMEYVRSLAEQVRQAIAAGRSDRQIMGEVAPPDDMKTWWRFLQWKHEDSLRSVLAAVRGGWGGF